MENCDYRPNERRGSSQPDDMEGEFGEGRGGIQSITQLERGSQRAVSKTRRSNPQPEAGSQSLDDGPWQDYGGESGEVF